MVFATVPDAPPTRRNHRATSWPAPISAKEPNIVGSRFNESAFWCVPILSGVDIAPLRGPNRLYHFAGGKKECGGTEGLWGRNRSGEQCRTKRWETVGSGMMRALMGA